MLIEYDKRPGISNEERVKSLADSVRRALEEIETSIEELKNTVSADTKKEV